ncbi:MAG: hypothetical protein RLP15_04540 [Cryomorphaceae bacterium]
MEKTKELLAAEALYLQLTDELADSVVNGNHNAESGPTFNTRSALAKAKKAKELMDDYKLEQVSYDTACEKVYNDLMERNKLEQAIQFAKELKM